MDHLWWRLPGPSGFLDRVVHELREGRCVVLALPEHAPDGLRPALYQRVATLDWWYWKVIDLAEEATQESPARLLHRLTSPAGAARVADARGVAESPGFRRRLLWVEGVTAATWPRWYDFLGQYVEACRAVLPAAERVLFCVPVAGPPAARLPAGKEALSCLPWRGVAGRLDMALYLAQGLSGDPRPPLHRRVALAVGVELAGTDPRLGVELAGLGLSDLLQPGPLLRAVAQRRGWSARDCTAAHWLEGTLDDLEGAEYVHSAALAVAGREGDLRRRVWRGEVGVVFPFIEEQRLRLLEAREVRRHLRLPLETPFGRIDDPRDLEIGHIWRLTRRARLSPETDRLLEYLMEMRHALAHLEPVAPGHLLAAEVLCADRPPGPGANGSS